MHRVAHAMVVGDDEDVETQGVQTFNGAVEGVILGRVVRHGDNQQVDIHIAHRGIEFVGGGVACHMAVAALDGSDDGCAERAVGA